MDLLQVGLAQHLIGPVPQQAPHHLQAARIHVQVQLGHDLAHEMGVERDAELTSDPACELVPRVFSVLWPPLPPETATRRLRL